MCNTDIAYFLAAYHTLVASSANPIQTASMMTNIVEENSDQSVCIQKYSQSQRGGMKG